MVHGIVNQHNPTMVSILHHSVRNGRVSHAKTGTCHICEHLVNTWTCIEVVSVAIDQWQVVLFLVHMIGMLSNL